MCGRLQISYLRTKQKSQCRFYFRGMTSGIGLYLSSGGEGGGGRILGAHHRFFGKLTANELPMRGGGSHKKISEPSWGSGKFYGDNQNPPTPYWLVQFFCLCKIYSCLLTPKCTRYHVVTSTNKLTSVFDQIFSSLKANVAHRKGYQSHVETSRK